MFFFSFVSFVFTSGGVFYNAPVITKIGIAAGIAGAAYFGYQCYSPTSQLYGSTLHRCAPKSLALTYDDGPNDACTGRLLDVLERHEIKATFFLIGKFVAARPQLARAVTDAGHLLGNHTYTHPNLLLLSKSRIQRELADGSAAISDATGVKVRFFRPPFGARRPAVLNAARELGLKPVMWDVTSFDWRGKGADAIERCVRKRIDEPATYGHIVLLHDGGHSKMGADRHATVEATQRLIVRYKDLYKFCRIDEI